MGLPQVTLGGKNPPANARDKRCRWDPWVWKILWSGGMETTPIFLPCLHVILGIPWSLAGHVHMVAKSQTELKLYLKHIDICTSFVCYQSTMLTTAPKHFCQRYSPKYSLAWRSQHTISPTQICPFYVELCGGGQEFSLQMTTTKSLGLLILLFA